MKIYYGLFNNNIDITDICFTKLCKNNIIIIPSNDFTRASYFSDPIKGVLKKIYVLINDKLTEYDEISIIKIDIINNTVENINKESIDTKLKNIQESLKLNFGSFNDELPEQKMVVRYLTGTEKVLELGGNIGRNSLIIASLLKHNDFVTLECDASIAKSLEYNRDINNLKFNIEPSALSKRSLIQKGWETMPSDILLTGYKWINTITYEDLKKKYNIEFDTLVLDCEGAFYYILNDMPELLNNINLIIMENDYNDYNHKLYVNDMLNKYNFLLHYSEYGGWGPCYRSFFEVWIKF